jgi:hypothetical protein
MYQLSSAYPDPAFTGILYFRNVNRNIYGMIDYSKFTTSQNIRAIAAKLIKDGQFRTQCLVDPQDDDMLTGDWK